MYNIHLKWCSYFCVWVCVCECDKGMSVAFPMCNHAVHEATDPVWETAHKIKRGMPTFFVQIHKTYYTLPNTVRGAARSCGFDSFLI